MVTPTTTQSDMRSHNIAFVGSTLPARYLLENAQQEGIKKIIVSSEIFLNSYQYLQSEIPGIKISIQPKRYIFRLFYLTFLVICAKILHRKIYIFHECCWPMLDLIIRLFAPKGCFIPIVNLGSFIKLSHTEFASYLNQNSIGRIGQFIQLHFFEMYKHRSDGGVGWVHVLVSKNYPSSIEVFKHFGRNKMDSQKGANSAISEISSVRKTVLFLIGREPVDDSYLSEIYRELFDVAIENGYKVSVKDHPNKGSRLNLEPEKCIVIDPAIPAELLESNYDIVVGVASASLSFFPERAVSLLKLIKEMPREDFEIRERYLQSISNNILYINEMKDFTCFLKKCDVSIAG